MMSAILTAFLLGALFFWVGFYLGNQMGRTEHIRKRLQNVRENNVS